MRIKDTAAEAGPPLDEVEMAPAATGPKTDSHDDNDDNDERGPCCCCCPRRDRPFMDGNTQAIAFLLDSVATSIVFSGSGAFLIPALLKLAKEEAGCAVEAPEGESQVPECHETIHGLKPSSLISTYATVVGLAAAMMMPLAGAIVDTTHYRRGLGRIASAIFLALLCGTIFLTSSNWFAISIVFCVMGFVGWFETMVLYAYLPELTNDESKLIRYTRAFTVLNFAGMVLYLGLIVGLSTGLYGKNDKTTLQDEIYTARWSQSIAFGIGVVLLPIAWGRLFAVRPPARVSQSSVWVAGFSQIYHTAKKVHAHYPALQWFFCAIAVGEAAVSGLLVLGITLLTDVLEFSGAENGTAVLIMLLSSIPGGYFSSAWTRRFNPVSSSIAALIVLIVNTILVAAILHGPDQQVAAYILAIPWGVGNGWKWTVDKMLYARILPAGQNTEFSGIYLFFRQCLTWLPPLLFTLINESSDISLQWGIASVNIFFLIALAMYVFGVGVGRYSTAVATAAVVGHEEKEEDDEEAGTAEPKQQSTLEQKSSLGPD